MPRRRNLFPSTKARSPSFISPGARTETPDSRHRPLQRKRARRFLKSRAEKPYSTNYRTCCDEAKPECYGKQLRPIQKIEGLNLAQYDVIFVGTPNWWGTMAPPVRTFLSQNAAVLKGKTVCLFQTNGGGGMQRCGKEFAELVPNSKVLPAQAFSGSSVRSSVKELEKFVTDRITVK